MAYQRCDGAEFGSSDYHQAEPGALNRSGLRFTTPQVTRVRPKTGWIVASPAGYLPGPGLPYGGPFPVDSSRLRGVLLS